MMYQRALHNLLLLRQIGGAAVPGCPMTPPSEQRSVPSSQPVSPTAEPAPNPVYKNEPKTSSVCNRSTHPTTAKPPQNAPTFTPNTSKTPILLPAPEPPSPKESGCSPTTPSF
jgi:hypothetical protein